MSDPATLRSLQRRSGVGGRLHLPAGITPEDPPITGVCEDSREVRAGALFCCMPGGSTDGHDFAGQAAEAGAAALAVERAVPVGLPQLVVPEVRAAVGPLALAGAGSPQEHLDLAGVTGTNGKTTVTHLLSSILEGAGRQCIAVGTLSGTLTTPRATDLARRLASGAGGRGTAPPCSRSARTGSPRSASKGLRFAASAFTNLSPGAPRLPRGAWSTTTGPSAACSADARTSLSVVCTDDGWGRRLAGELDRRGAALLARDDAEVLEVAARHSRFRWRGVEMSLPHGGRAQRLECSGGGHAGRGARCPGRPRSRRGSGGRRACGAASKS